MPKLISSSQPKFKFPKLIAPDLELRNSSVINKGMVTSFDPPDIDDGAVTVARNAVIRYDRTGRRNGNKTYTPVKPNSNQINHLTIYSKNDGTVNVIRIDSTGHVYSGNSISWTAVPPLATPITVDVTTRCTSIVINNRFFFTDDGNDVIQEVDLTVPQYRPLGNAPKYKYIVGFGNRIVGAYYTGVTSNPVLIGWSGDGNYGEWNPAVDLSAGEAPLIDVSESDADPISGLFATDNRMIILREHSIWLATKQPSASQPFYFVLTISKNGCDCPYSAAAVPDGICYLSYRYKSVFFYIPGEQPKRIGLPIELTMISEVQSLGAIFGAYDPINAEYSLSIPSSSGNTRTWKYNFLTEAWSYDDISHVNAITFVDFSATSVTMDELSGTMDALPGTMDSLGTPSAALPTRLLGLTSGDILQEDATAITDAGTPFQTDIASKTFTYPNINETIGATVLNVIPRVSTGTLALSYSKDDGNSWKQLKNVTVTAPQLENPILAKSKRQINTRRFMWMVSSSDVKFDLTGYEIHVYPGGESKK